MSGVLVQNDRAGTNPTWGLKRYPQLTALALPENDTGRLDFVDANYSDPIMGSILLLGVEH
jgi:hypothetical protein